MISNLPTLMTTRDLPVPCFFTTTKNEARGLISMVTGYNHEDNTVLSACPCGCGTTGNIHMDVLREKGAKVSSDGKTWTPIT